MHFWQTLPLPMKILIPGILAVLLIYFGKPKPAPEENKSHDHARIQVSAVLAVRESKVMKVFSQGTVQARREIDLLAQVAGTVIRVEPNFVSGDFFAAHQPLLQIEEHSYRKAKLLAQARLADAKRLLAEEKGRARQARKEWRDLGNEEANALFLRLPQLEAAEAHAAAMAAELEEAEITLQRTQVSAPFAGRIRATWVNLGQYLSVGTPIARVYDSAALEVRLPLSDQQLALIDIAPGQRLDNPQNAPEVILRARIADQDYQWAGRLTRSEASVDTASRMHYVIAEVAQPFAGSNTMDKGQNQAPLMVGLFVEAEIAGRQLDQVISLPRGTVIKRNRIFIAGKDQRAEEVSVHVLGRNEESVWIRSEIPDNTLIITEKLALLTQGSWLAPQVKAASSGADESSDKSVDQ